jgi:NAD-dependent DNA ligase
MKKLNESAIQILSMSDALLSTIEEAMSDLVDLIGIGNILYNYSTNEVLPIEDGIYDQLVVKLQNIDYDKFTPGAIPVINTSDIHQYLGVPINKSMEKPFTIMDKHDALWLQEEAWFPSILNYNVPINPMNYIEKPFYLQNSNGYVTKRIRDTTHNHPNLVGTLEKCKFVLTAQAKDLGVAEDSNTKIFERDFIAPLITNGIINNSCIEMIGTLKYDGVSIEADVNTEVISARTRGDTDQNIASDLTPILGGYRFPNAVELDKPIGMKFEAIVRYTDLARMNKIFGTNYINGRTAIIGILGSSDARKFKDFITLVPLQADFGPDAPEMSRLDEITFLNKYYATREYLRYTTFSGRYDNFMYMITSYVHEAEVMRQWSNFMYDGVVLEFADSAIRKKLGRKNSINQYAMAIKFNPLKKLTTFTGFSYTVGQNGQVTPMVHYQPVEFLGSIHTKSTASSLARFQSLDLYIGDTIEVTYVNDVMPYVTKPNLESNIENHKRKPRSEELFPTICPCCGTKLVIGPGTATCPNLDCPDRARQRLSNMMAKLNIKDFSDAAIDTIGIAPFAKLMEMTVNDFSELGPTNKMKLYHQLQNLKANRLPDYRIIGALGFTNIASKTWKLIFSKYPLIDLFNDLKNHEDVRGKLLDIKGIGDATVDTIVNEFDYFYNDLEYIISHYMYIPTYIGNTDAKYIIRVSGFRDQLLMDVLNMIDGVDASDGSVTKSTTILLVPYVGYDSGNVKKANKYNIPIVAVGEFMENPGDWIPGLTDIRQF